MICVIVSGKYTSTYFLFKMLVMTGLTFIPCSPQGTEFFFSFTIPRITSFGSIHPTENYIRRKYRNSRHFVELECSLPNSQRPVTGPSLSYTNLDHALLNFFNINYNIILPSNSCSSHGLFPSVYIAKPLYPLVSHAGYVAYISIPS